MRAVDNEFTEAQLNARARDVKDVTTHKGWTHIEGEIDRQLAAVERKILSGDLDDDSYRRYCGVREGLMDAKKAPATLIDEGDESDAGRE